MAKPIVIRIVGDASGFKGAADEADGIFDRIGSSATRVAGLIGAAFAGVQIGSFLKDSVGAGSDLNETISKATTIFGDNADAIKAWAKTADKRLGQTEQGALDAAATFGNLFSQLKIGGQVATDMSTKVVELGSDFASFHNADPTEVIEAMTAAFRGEYDAVQRYVPTINAATVEQKALAMGLASSKKELTEQHKALATYAVLTEGAGAAAGDFERTSDGLANRMRIARARFENFQATLGQKLVPVVLAAMDAMDWFGLAAQRMWERWKPAIEELGDQAQYWFGEAVGSVKAFVAAFKAGDGDITSSGLPGFFERLGGLARDAADLVAAHWDTVREVLEVVVPILGSALAAYMAFQRVAMVIAAVQGFTTAIKLLGLALAANPVGLVVVAIGALIGGLILAYQRSEAFRDIVNQVGAAVKQWFGGLIDAFRNGGIGEAVGYVWDSIKGLFDTLAGWFTGTALPLIWEWVSGAAQALGRWVVDGTTYLLDELPGWLAALGDWLVNTAIPAAVHWMGEMAGKFAAWVVIATGDLLAKLPVWLGTLVNWLATDAIPGLITKGYELQTAFMSWLVDIVPKIPGKLWDIWWKVNSAIAEATPKIVGWVYDLGIDFINGLIDGVWSKAGELQALPGKVAGGMVDGFKAALGISSPSKVMRQLGEFTMQGFRDGLGFVDLADHYAVPDAGPMGGRRSPQLVPALAGAGAFGGATINVTAQTNADPWAIAREVDWALRTAGR